ncbi:MAG: 2-hydroxyacyl-CoA dehydratase subunit D [Planctomycetota bacterium]|jgi:benzoyl-CoA reductase/2-hydroxyglutaryl-CoA dehydratase subunit BcrC/BadD/HgdB
MADEKKRKSIKAAGTMKKIMADYFLDLDAAAKDPGRKVAWCTSVGPAELLRAYGFEVHFPENHAAILGATRTAMDYIPAANAIGYSPEICSYLTSDVGAYLKGVTPLTKAYGIESLPKPDVLAYNTNQCRDVQEWMSWWGREFDAPVVGVTPPRSVGRITEKILDDVEAQFKWVSARLEEPAGIPLDPVRLKETVALSLEATNLWEEVLNLARKVPSPLTFFDGTIHMGPIVVLRGTQTAVDYYRELKTELLQRVEEGMAAVAEEAHRLYWDGMPVWGKLRNFSELLAGLKTCTVASTYCNSWVFPHFDPEDPFRSMGLAYTEIFINRDEPFKEGYIERLVSEFSVDGILFHDSKTCPNNSNARYGMPQRLQERLGVPTLVIQGDLNDLRLFSEEQTVTNIEAFIEGMS